MSSRGVSAPSAWFTLVAMVPIVAAEDWPWKASSSWSCSAVLMSANAGTVDSLTIVSEIVVACWAQTLTTSGRKA